MSKSRIILIFPALMALLLVVSCGPAAQTAESLSNSGSIDIGYGQTSRDAQAFSVSETKMTEDQAIIYDNIYDYLRGRVAGVVVEDSDSGTPKITIRGSKNVWGNDPDPLFILDGNIIPDISVVRPEQVYSIEVLKDAAASAYGSRSSNGVIMIKSKFAHEKEVQEEEQRRLEKLQKKEGKKKK